MSLSPFKDVLEWREERSPGIQGRPRAARAPPRGKSWKFKDVPERREGRGRAFKDVPERREKGGGAFKDVPERRKGEGGRHSRTSPSGERGARGHSRTSPSGEKGHSRTSPSGERGPSVFTSFVVYSFSFSSISKYFLISNGHFECHGHKFC